jgi:glycosyltransferase involved in cell wall biosynthesis
VQTIHSALSQTYSNFEIIIVDDGSTDNTHEIVKNLVNEKVHYYKIKNSERGAARNYGIKASKGEYVTFLDSDDILYPNYLQNAFDSLIRENYPPFLHTAYEIKNSEGKLLYQINDLRSDNINFITKGNSLSCLGVFIKKEIMQDFKFNEDRELAGSEDWELWLRILANFGIKTNNNITACLIHHNSRSVLDFNESQLFKRKELALKYAFLDPMVKELFTPYYKKIDAFADSYISLHLALAGHNKRSLKYFLQSLKSYPFSLISRRTMAILKHVLLNNLNRLFTCVV